jgi:hypothetical protein
MNTVERALKDFLAVRPKHVRMAIVGGIDKRRPQDRVDLTELSKIADDAEWVRAEIAVRLIAERGFGRGRDLAAALEEWRERARVIRSDP